MGRTLFLVNGLRLRSCARYFVGRKAYVRMMHCEWAKRPMPMSRPIQTMPARSAKAAAAVRDETPSLLKMLSMWRLTVL
jgi:hypothetical protein